MRRSRSKRRQIIFSALGLLVVTSMILGLVLTVIPQPRQPTPTLTPLPRITLIPTPTLTPTVTPTGS